MFTTWRETWSYLTRRGFKAGQSLLVAGSGGNGLSFTAHAANLGASQVTMIGAPRLAAAARAKAGVGVYVDYHDPAWAEQVKAAQPDGFDLVIDALGRADMGNRLLPFIKPEGLYAVYGIDEFRQAPLNAALARGPFRVSYMGKYDEAESHQAIGDAVRRGQLDASLWYDAANPYPLDAINEAFAAVKARHSIKALVRLRG